MDADLPFIDEHALAIPAPRDRVWSALRAQAERALIAPHGDPFRRFLRTSPPSGFGVADSVAEQRLTLAGRHRFARYALVFDLSDAADGDTRLAARTYAAFSGPHGRVYRALVIGTRAHVVVTRRILVAVKRRALAPAPVPAEDEVCRATRQAGERPD